MADSLSCHENILCAPDPSEAQRREIGPGVAFSYLTYELHDQFADAAAFEADDRLVLVVRSKLELSPSG